MQLCTIIMISIEKLMKQAGGRKRRKGFYVIIHVPWDAKPTKRASLNGYRAFLHIHRDAPARGQWQVRAPAFRVQVIVQVSG